MLIIERILTVFLAKRKDILSSIDEILSIINFGKIRSKGLNYGKGTKKANIC